MIRQYNNPEGTVALINSAALNDPKRVLTSTNTGAPVGGAGVVKQDSAITTMILCNVGTPDPTDESVNSVSVNIYIVRGAPTGGPGATPDTTNGSNLIVSNLTIPAGETVFFSDEKIILDGGVDGSKNPDELWISSSDTDLIAVTVSILQV